MNALLSRARIDVVSNAKKKTHVARSSSCTIRFSARVSTAAASLFVFATRKLARAILVSSNVLFSNCVVSRQLCVNAFTARVLCKPHREDDGRDHQKTGGSINATTTLDDETRLLDLFRDASEFCAWSKNGGVPVHIQNVTRRGKRSRKIGCLLTIPFFPLSLFRVSFFKKKEKNLPLFLFVTSSKKSSRCLSFCSSKTLFCPSLSSSSRYYSSRRSSSSPRRRRWW